ncbi:MAG: hypothetical protein KN64_01850 [Sulfurovum sp. AS07-7]|nr:MAG: hypothetical protein KN64_01850 [Sulfurovum sp. AS07-7]
MLFLNQFKLNLNEKLHLNNDKADDITIDERIRNDVEIKGASLWILICAILVASIGLNVNSTAVIIGAMLISPLMGSIMGIGYGAGINDILLIKKSFKNLFQATLFSLLASTIYFYLSPLQDAHSELLARTSPNLWDVLIAFFGGLAGIIGITRKEKSNVIPGVAIATALMPPLCTAGFGLANGNLTFFLGAFYLYSINFIFIAFSTLLVISISNVTKIKYENSDIAKKIKIYIGIAVFITFIPSLYLAYHLVNEAIYKATVKHFINEKFENNQTNIAKLSINFNEKSIKIIVVGKHISDDEIKKIQNELYANGLTDTTLKVFQNGEIKTLDIQSFKDEMNNNFYTMIQEILNEQNEQIFDLETQIKNQNTLNEESALKELTSFFPQITDIEFNNNINLFENNQTYEQNISYTNKQISIESTEKLIENDKNKIKNWLYEKYKVDSNKTIFKIIDK